MYVLLHLALELTDLLLAQLVITRRELESSQYGPFTSDLTVDNQNRGDTRGNNSVDNSLQTESLHRANDNAPRRNVDRDRFSRNRGEMPSAEERLSAHGNRRLRIMARQLKLFRRFNRRRSGNSLSENQTSNSVAARPSDNDDDNNYDDNAQNEDNRQSTSENALSAEVQSIVERIQSSSSIDNDDRGDVRTGVENRTIDTANESRNSNESYRRSYRNATVSEPAVRRTNESRGPQETDSRLTYSTENWRNYLSYTSSGDEQSARSSHQRTRWARAACSSLLERSLHRYSNSDPNNNRRFPHSREGASLRREFNVPELQVNNVPVNDLDNLSGNPRRRQHTPPTPPHTPPPYLINNFLHNADNNRNNDRTNESTDQPGPSWAGQSNNNRTRV